MILPLVNKRASWATHVFPRLRYRPLARSRPVPSEGEFAERLTACLKSRSLRLRRVVTSELSRTSTIRALYQRLATRSTNVQFYQQERRFPRQINLTVPSPELMAGSIVVTGIKEIDRKMKGLERKVQRKILVQNMRKGMKLVLEDAISRAPVLTGLLKKNIKLRAMKRKRNRVGLLVNIMPDPGFVKGEYWYPAAVEYGHGTVPPHPFMRPAYTMNKDHSRDLAMRGMLISLEREIKA